MSADRKFSAGPGQGAFDLPGFVRLVLAAGSAGPLSLEIFNDVRFGEPNARSGWPPDDTGVS